MSTNMSRRACLATASTIALLAAMAEPAIGQTAIPPAAPDPSPATSAPASSDANANNGAGDIIVTAQRRSESLSKTPVAVAVVSGETLAKQAILSEKDLQAAVPGLLVRATQNSNQLNYSLRGQSVDAFSFGTPAVLPYENEVQIPSNAAGAFFDLASVQVLKGPQGTLFGRNSTGGAVLFTTAKPTDDFGGFLTARYGSYDEVNVIGALNVPIVKDKVLLRVAGFYENHRGYQYNLYDGTRLGKVDRYAGRATLTIKPTNDVENVTVVDYSHSGGSSMTPVEYSGKPPAFTSPIPASGFYSPALDLALGFPGAFAAYLAANPKADPNGLYPSIAAQNARGPYLADVDTDTPHSSKSMTVTNTTTVDLGANTKLKNIFGYTYARSTDTADLDGSPFGIEYSGLNGLQNQQRQFSEELQLQGETFANRLKYVIGGFYLHDTTFLGQVSNFFNLNPIIPAQTVNYESNSVVRDYAGYAQGTYDLSDFIMHGLGITAGVRYTSEKNSQAVVPGTTLYNFPGAANYLANTIGKASYQFGIDEQFNNNLLVYGVTRHSFRSDGYNGATPHFAGFADTGGAAFKPEIATDYELGAKYKDNFATFPVTLNVAIYRLNVTDQQKTFYAVLPNLGLLSLTANVPKTRVQGVEVDGTVRPAPWLSVGGSLTYTDAKFTQNIVTVEGTTNAFGPYPDTPKWTGNVFADASIPAGDLGTIDLRAEAYSQSSFFFGSLNNTSVPGTQLHGYTLVNLRAGIDNIEKSGISVAFSAHNLTNKVYFVGGLPTAGVFDVNSALPGDPRTFMGEVSFKF